MRQKLVTIMIVFVCIIINQSFGVEKMDTITTSSGKLIIHFIGHGSLAFEFNGKVIHVDPFSRLADYDKLPKADIILITHSHSDHFDLDAIGKIKKDSTIVVYTEACQNTGKYTLPATIMKNGDISEILNIKIEAVPAYNIIHKRADGNPFHPKAEGNGYILTFGDKRLYIAGDTENIPEMKDFGKIDIAFLPMNLPYTMTPELVAEAAKLLHPKILYPYHFGNTDTSLLLGLLKDEKSIDVRIRDMK